MFDLDGLTEEELRVLGVQVAERLKAVVANRYEQEVGQFNVGDNVLFENRDGVPVFGTVTKLNRKTVGVMDEHGERWRLSPSVLSMVQESALDEELFFNSRSTDRGVHLNDAFVSVADSKGSSLKDDVERFLENADMSNVLVFPKGAPRQ